VVTSSSNKQKVNTNSLTETELVGVHDKSGDILFTHHFLKAQGYTINENVIFHDNMSTLSFKKNGRTSSSKHTKHIKAKYFFIQHYHQTKEINLRYCPTDNMWADVLTKPLQGSKFQQMCAILMNYSVDYNEEPPMIDPIPVSSSSNVPTKPQIFPINPLLWECVEVSSSAISKNGGKKKEVTWHTTIPVPAALPSICCNR
jgi:hypothetical protein